ncbi:MAG: amidohydrolase family protein [Enterocloster sp.]
MKKEMNTEIPDLVVTNVSVLTEDFTVSEAMTVLVKEGIISEIRPYTRGDETLPAGERLDGRKKLLMPGLVDCHMHTGQQLLKGRVLDELPMIWTRIMLPFESTLTAERMRLSARLAALEMIHSGTTAFIDAGSYYMEEAAQVYEQSGLRGVLSVSTMDDESLPESIACTAEEAVKMTDRLYDSFDRGGKHSGEETPPPKGLLKVAYSLRSLISCSEELICCAAEHARERGALLQAHMNEYPNEINFFLQRKQKRPVEYLDSLGVFTPRFISAHSLLLSEEEKDILKERGAKVCHCPFSNCGKGVPDTPGLLRRGICVGLGTDGAAHGGLSLWNEMKIFRSVMNTRYGVATCDPAIMPAKQILAMATKNGYELMGEEKGGMICHGSKADFITVDLYQPHLYPTGNLANSLLELVTAADVADMAVDGRLLMRDRKVLTLDEDSIMAEAAEFLERQNR